MVVVVADRTRGVFDLIRDNYAAVIIALLPTALNAMVNGLCCIASVFNSMPSCEPDCATGKTTMGSAAFSCCSTDGNCGIGHTLHLIWASAGSTQPRCSEAVEVLVTPTVASSARDMSLLPPMSQLTT